MFGQYREPSAADWDCEEERTTMTTTMGRRSSDRAEDDRRGCARRADARSGRPRHAPAQGEIEMGEGESESEYVPRRRRMARMDGGDADAY